MKRKIVIFLLNTAFFFAALITPVIGAEIENYSTPGANDLSLKNELQHAIDRGLGWLAKNQNPDGYWSQPDHPALTGLVLTAFMGDPSGRMRAKPPEFVHLGYQYLLDNVKPDGGIYVRDMTNYNTSVSIMALVMAANPVFESVILNARNFEVGLQDNLEESDPMNGGVGYGGRYKHSDMSNTMFALESLYYTRNLVEDRSDSEKYKKLNWQAAIRFIERSQNLPSHNDQDWASDDPQNKGGFIYFPGDSKAGEMDLGNDRKALRSYGSITYAGLLSYIYADLKKDDPRVVAAIEWLQKNYTLAENPGMGPQGLYYYYHTMAKALATYGLDEFTLEDGRKVNWRKELSLKLLDLQNKDGFWMNENGRWWEKDPVLVTSYAVIILEIIYRGL
jgi:squalene-hopene/tetraprenyl-beta-curcumene cyclase